MTCADRRRRRFIRRRVGTFGLAIILAALGACVEPPPPGPAAPPQQLPAAGPAPGAALTPVTPSATGEPTTLAAATLLPAPTEAAVAAAPARPPGPPRPDAPTDPRRLIGLTQERLQLVLGDADFVRRDGPAQVWRYDAADCSLDVFLFREGEMQRVTHVASRARKAESPDMPLNTCYDHVLRLRRTDISG
jgi:hypothetical protein